MERSCKDLREHAMKIIDNEKKGNDTANRWKARTLLHMLKNKFSTDEMINMHLNYTIKSEIIVITLENLQELLIVFPI